MRPPNTEQTNLAKVQVGDWLRVTPVKVELYSGRTVEHPNEVFTAVPSTDKGGPRKVTDVTKVKGEGWTVTFDDGTKLGPRNGTASAYRYKLTSAGEPIADPAYPVCPTCDAQPDNPACQTSSGAYTSMHKAREKLLDQAAKVEKILDDHDGCENCSHGFDSHYKTEQADGRACRVFACHCPKWEGQRAGKSPVKGVDVVKGEREHVAPAGRVADPERRALDTDRPDDEPIEGEPDTDGERCVTCKGFGLVRGQGKRAGERYKTLNGAQTAQANGNAVDCPECDGLGLIDLAA